MAHARAVTGTVATAAGVVDATADAGAIDAVTRDGASSGTVVIHHGDNLAVARTLPDAAFTLIYLDPPFNTGRPRAASASPSRPSPPARGRRPAEGAGHLHSLGGPVFTCDGGPAGDEVQGGFRGRVYPRVRGEVPVYDDSFDDYCGFLRPRLVEAWRLLTADGTLYVHVDYREAHYVKVMMDTLFGRDRFLNELIWAYDYGAKSRRRWPSKHDTILVYVKDPAGHWFDADAVDRIPYMAPGLVTPEKAARGKLPTDVWWHTIVPTNGAERTGYPTQKPEGLLRRIVQASSRRGDRVLDLFAGSGTTGAVAAALGRHAVLVDDSQTAVDVMRRRMPHARLV